MKTDLTTWTTERLVRERDEWKAEMERAASYGRWDEYGRLFDLMVQPIADELWRREVW